MRANERASPRQLSLGLGLEFVASVVSVSVVTVWIGREQMRSVIGFGSTATATATATETRVCQSVLSADVG